MLGKHAVSRAAIIDGGSILKAVNEHGAKSVLDYCWRAIVVLGTVYLIHLL
jgi:hypothetical protein